LNKEHNLGENGINEKSCGEPGKQKNWGKSVEKKGVKMMDKIKKIVQDHKKWH